MKKPLQQSRNNYLELLLCFLWREWTALGVAGRKQEACQHVTDPEALLLFTCSVGRYDQRLFDEVLDWLKKNSAFINVQRMKNILKQEDFSGGEVLSAVAGWLSREDKSGKWKLLAGQDYQKEKVEALFLFPDGRALPRPADCEPVFLAQGFQRNRIALRGYAQVFAPDAAACQFLRMRALFGLNARCDVLTYLAMNGSGHPRQVARELYYSQKAIHDVMTGMACSGVIQSSRSARERVFRISPEKLPFLTDRLADVKWINWPVLLSAAEAIWHISDELSHAGLEPLVESSEILLVTTPLFERLNCADWMPLLTKPGGRQGIAHLHEFADAFSEITGLSP